MDFLINPNVSYVLMVIGFLVAVMAMFSPGTGVLEVVGLSALALAGYGLANLPVNWWAFAIIAAAVLPFFFALRRRQLVPLLLGLAWLLFVAGSALLIRGEGWLPGVNIWLILLLSSILVGLSWLIATKTLQAMRARPSFDLDRLVGMTGQATTDIRGQGSVYVNGENWSATCKSFIPAGNSVRVLRRKGLVLEVEPYTGS
jgi:membrane-bound serine protease (ClpP class)